jgi:hypothetical protein
MTKSNKTRQNDEKTPIGLTSRQIKALPFIVASSTYTAGCKKAKVDRTTFYKWLMTLPSNRSLNVNRRLFQTRPWG